MAEHKLKLQRFHFRFFVFIFTSSGSIESFLFFFIILLWHFYVIDTMLFKLKYLLVYIMPCPSRFLLISFTF